MPDDSSVWSHVDTSEPDAFSGAAGYCVFVWRDGIDYFFSIVSFFSVVVPPGPVFVSVSVVFSVVVGASLIMVVSLVSPGGLMVTCFCSQEAKNSGARIAGIR